MPVLQEYHPAEFRKVRREGLFFVAHLLRLFTFGPEASMKTMNRVGLAVLALGVAFTSGCGDRHTNKEVYYLVGVNMALPYWQTGAKGFNQAAAQYKVTAKVVGPENYDPQAELAALQNAVAAKPAGILITVADEAVVGPAIDSAIASGIPVITIDSDAKGSKRLFFIGTNNLEAGRLGGHRVVEKLGGTGNVVFFSISGQPNMEERLKGFKDVLDTRPGIHIVDVIDIKTDARTAFDKTQELLALTGPKKINAFVCLESASGKMVSDAIKRSGASDRLLVAWDVNQDTLDGIKAGTIDSTIAQKPFTMGYIGLRALDEIFHAPVPTLDKDFKGDAFSPFSVFVDTGTSLVDQKNVDSYIASAAAHQ
jgi:ribose transport system substrate-binding protein